MSPTIYEVAKNPTLQESAYKSLTAIMSKPDNIISQLKLQRDLICSLWLADSANKIVNIIEEFGEIAGKLATNTQLHLEIISVAGVRCYLNALLCLNKLDRFFVAATEILQKYDGYDFASVVHELMEDVAFNKLVAIIGQRLNFDESADVRDLAIYLREAKATMLMILNIASYCKVPSFMNEKLSKTLDVIDKTLTVAFKKLGDSKQGAGEGAKFCREFLQDFNLEKDKYKISESEDEKETTYQLQVKKILNRVQAFADTHKSKF